MSPIQIANVIYSVTKHLQFESYLPLIIDALKCAPTLCEKIKIHMQYKEESTIIF